MTDDSWLEPMRRETERIKEETERIREENKRLREATKRIKAETRRIREENKVLSKIKVKEQFGHISDGFLLSEKEINDLRDSKGELSKYGREKLKELMNKEQLRLTEDDLSDLLWLVRNYGDKLEKYPEENQVSNLTSKLEKMLNEMG
jgi:hypothetical protein